MGALTEIGRCFARDGSGGGSCPPNGGDEKEAEKGEQKGSGPCSENSTSPTQSQPRQAVVGCERQSATEECGAQLEGHLKHRVCDF
ncbi:hypothetical protein ACFLZP_00900 [Patescibacteria group bacterium]